MHARLPFLHALAARVLCALVIGSAGWGAGAAAAAPEAAALDETAHCIAVMQGHADELVRQVKAGDAAQQPILRTELVRASMLVGRTYQSGLHDGKEAKARLKAAQAAQAGWDAARRASVHQACVRRADTELASATAAERYIVDRVADATMQRLLSAH